VYVLCRPQPLVEKLDPCAVKCIFVDTHMDNKATSVGVFVRGENL
jgi:hypothetical protein